MLIEQKSTNAVCLVAQFPRVGNTKSQSSTQQCRCHPSQGQNTPHESNKHNQHIPLTGSATKTVVHALYGKPNRTMPYMPRGAVRCLKQARSRSPLSPTGTEVEGAQSHQLPEWRSINKVNNKKANMFPRTGLIPTLPYCRGGQTVRRFVQAFSIQRPYPPVMSDMGLSRQRRTSTRRIVRTSRTTFTINASYTNDGVYHRLNCDQLPQRRGLSTTGYHTPTHTHTHPFTTSFRSAHVSLISCRLCSHKHLIHKPLQSYILSHINPNLATLATARIISLPHFRGPP